MDKSGLLSDLATKSGGSVISTELVETTGSVKRYKSIVFSVGAENDGVGIAQKYDVYFFVKDEGEAGEVAYYADSGFKNFVERNPTGSTSVAIYGIFSNNKLRERVIGAIAKAVRAKLVSPGGDADKRVVHHYVENLNGLTDLFMAYVASNGTIQSNGGTATDSDIDFVVQTEAWALIGAALAI